jgi:hypothetical protein
MTLERRRLLVFHSPVSQIKQSRVGVALFSPLSSFHGRRRRIFLFQAETQPLQARTPSLGHTQAATTILCSEFWRAEPGFELRRPAGGQPAANARWRRRRPGLPLQSTRVSTLGP